MPFLFYVNNINPFPPVAPWIETFTGDNGSLPNPIYWVHGTNISIQNNQLRGYVTNEAKEASSLFVFPGDFEVTVLFDDLSTGTGLSNRMELITQNNDSSELGLIGARYQFGPKFLTNIRHNSVWYGEVTASRNNNFGGFGAKRTGTSLTMKYKDGNGSWVNLRTSTVDAEDFKVRLYYSANSGSVSGDFDDFTIVSGLTKAL